MCQGGCKGDCGCGQISTTKGEKGDKGVAGKDGGLVLPKYVLFELTAVTDVTPVPFNYTLEEDGDFLLVFESNLSSVDANQVNSYLYKNATAQSSNINYRHRYKLNDGDFKTFTHTAVISGVIGDEVGFALLFNGNLENGSLVITKVSV